MYQIRAYLATIILVLVLGMLDGCTKNPSVQQQALAPGLRVCLPTFSRQVWSDTSYVKMIGSDSFEVNIQSGILEIQASQTFADSTHRVEWTISTTYDDCGPENDYIPDAATETDWDGDGDANNHDTDRDGDGIANATDNCPGVYNPSQVDSDGDGRGDACDETDGSADSPTTAGTDEDRDGDSIPNDVDNCPNIPNSSQTDTDCDGVGDPGDPSPEGRIRGSLIGGKSYIVFNQTNGTERVVITVKRWKLH